MNNFPERKIFHRENKQKRCKINNNFENRQNILIIKIAKNIEIGHLGMMNEHNEIKSKFTFFRFYVILFNYSIFF